MSAAWAVLAFRSDRFRSGSDQATLTESAPPGRECAEWITRGFTRAGARVDPAEPIEGEGGWFIFGEVSDARFEVFVQWAPLGEHASDHWILQLRLKRSIIERMFREDAPSKLAEVSQIAESAVREIPGAVGIRWLSEEEFRRLY